MTKPLNAFSHGRTHALVVLTRLAQRRGDTRLLDEAFAGRLEELAELAVNVAVEVGDPLGQVLAQRVAKKGVGGVGRAVDGTLYQEGLPTLRSLTRDCF